MPHTIAPSIDGVSTSTAGFLGEAGQGPTDQAELVTGLVDFQRIFGGPQSGLDLFLGVHQFFENGGKAGLGRQALKPRALGRPPRSRRHGRRG